ncbi:NRAMP family divalent metal transporter [Pseudalkalibacillus berkeleyi]|uniref:Divalent metal cation transporter n=1 Tax=Pseudalkalibacillus berkeleyi TaxID=1069813 RepID=A0ABS9GXA3_9BACL|nr:NRAMP family divalent metal transporter [Pseudalkalibacillus berkeleyi]MCF6136361.1 divalent metal cation transporter [Pseudalkalibacillus berkeleyi]
MKQSNRSILLGAAFLMATSAIGPGFLTQTTYFTEALVASFGFVILVSIIIDIGAQLNIWRIIAVAERRTQDIANMVLPGLGYFVAFLIVIGGLAFNIGNIAGAGLGSNVILGVSPEIGALLSGLIAIGIFLLREANKIMDRFTQVLGFLMIALTVFVMFSASPPVGEAVQKTFMPDKIDLIAIITLVGGTVGGYITFSGGHRLLDAGVKGVDSLPEVTKSSVSAIGIASIMRIFLFLATLGVVAQGFTLDPSNPPASVFQFAAGNIGYKMFGVIMWSAAITSVIGAAYTSVSFIRTMNPKLEQYHKYLIIGFIAISTLVFVSIGKPVNVLILVGALNGLILPISLGVMLIAAHKPKIVGSYKHPIWLTVFGSIIVVAMSYMGIITMMDQIPKLFS